MRIYAYFCVYYKRGNSINHNVQVSYVYRVNEKKRHIIFCIMLVVVGPWFAWHTLIILIIQLLCLFARITP